jgi:arsenate reductase-like glutaredoxin family protein
MKTTPVKSKTKKEVRDLRAEAVKIAKSIKIDGQTKAEISAISSGIQRGMEQFLRQQSEKSRDLDKRVKKVKQALTQASQAEHLPALAAVSRQQSARLPWLLLAISWGLFGAAAVANYFQPLLAH